ncbi:MAG: carboxypeptidase-like regulatory domain-containing protein [Pedobacter sp.]|nr:MAG: carboxypeptidase-like regulatory domain-containing protein [Pedobacter sp.]
MKRFMKGWTGSIYLALIFLLIRSFSLHAQETQMRISGTIVDANTKQPLSRASVYLDQTTKSTFTTDSGQFVLSVASGNYTLAVSHVGYNSASVSVTEQFNPSFKIELVPAEKILDEVVINVNSKKTDYFFLFHVLFLGAGGKDCNIQNRKALFFKYSDTHVLTAEANAPLIIDNYALGYRVYYDLTSFVHYAGRISYTGHSRFEEMKPKDTKEEKTWRSNRAAAYYGSVTHFLRSLVNNKLKKDGFLVKKLVKAHKAPPSIPVLKKWHSSTATKSPDTLVSMRWNGRDYSPADSTLLPETDSPYRWGEHAGYNILYPDPVKIASIIKPTSSEGNFKLNFKNSLFVTYTKKKTKEDVWGSGDDRPTFITSIVTMLVPETFVDLRGNLADPNAMINEGYWAKQRIANQLPFDYNP